MSATTTRKKVGIKAGIVGLIINVFLTIFKVSVGVLTRSQAILADGVNSLTDSLSSLITIFGFYIAGKPADRDHPFGHERSEYIAGFTVAIVTAYLAVEIFIGSIKSLIADARPTFNGASFAVLILSIVLKLILAWYYNRQANKIDSSMLKAAVQDSKNDVFMSAELLVALSFSNRVPFNLDAILGIILSIYIMYSAFRMISGFMSELLGNRPSESLLIQIKEILDDSDEIFGYHDLLVHQYGNETAYGSVHVELDQSMNLIVAHDIIDRLEYEIYKKTKIKIVAHPDPLDIDNIELHKIYQLIKKFLRDNYEQTSFHDLRIIKGVLHFDLVLNGLKCEEDLTLEIGNLLIENKINYPIKITFDIQQLI